MHSACGHPLASAARLALGACGHSNKHAHACQPPMYFDYVGSAGFKQASSFKHNFRIHSPVLTNIHAPLTVIIQRA